MAALRCDVELDGVSEPHTSAAVPPDGSATPPASTPWRSSVKTGITLTPFSEQPQVRYAESVSLRLASEGGSERERKLASALVAIAAHLVAEIGESDAIVGIGEGELPAGAGMAEAPWA
jgi:hypothetical protein